MTKASELPAWFVNHNEEAMDEWVATRPLLVKALFAEFPFGTIFDVHQEKWFMFGATESGVLIIAPVNAATYDEAIMRREYLCPDHVRTKH